MTSPSNIFPKIHNATWPGVVGKGTADSEPCLELDEMLDLTCAAEIQGVKFDGIDLFLAAPHLDLAKMSQEVPVLVDKLKSRNMEIGSLVAPVWSGSALDTGHKREIFLTAVKQSCQAAAMLREAGVRPGGCVRIDSSCSVDLWARDPENNQKVIADTFRMACEIAGEYGEVLAAEGEICWGGMHSWKRMVELLERVDLPQILGFQADMSHTLLYLLGYNAPEDRILPEDFVWGDTATFDAAYRRMTDVLRPWTVDLHIAQNDGSVYGSGSHDKTGRHCLAKDPNGKLNVPKYAGFWLADADGLLKRFNHICWDGCMFPNEVMRKPGTWNDILETMLLVRNDWGWR
ncbi:MAG: TIM barrel protein [Planctomycetia bacterium]|nr:TIM barrel protein [Planctomycetia bacterium]